MTGRRRVLVIAQGPQAQRRSIVERLLGVHGPDLRCSATAEEDRFDIQYPLESEGSNGTKAHPEDLLASLFRLEAAVVGEEGQLLAVALGRDHLRIDLVMEERLDRASVTEAVETNGRNLGLLDEGPVSLDARLLSPKLSAILETTGLRLVEVETARVAIALGYYENPRRSTMEEIGEVLGISKSAVFYRLNGLERKAVQRLIELSEPDKLPGVKPRSETP